MRSRRISRRSVLRGAGGIAISLPMLEIMQPRRALAAGPKRVVFFFTPNGTNDRKAFVPQTTGAGFTLPPETAALTPVKDKLLVVSKVNMKSALTHPDGDQHAVGMASMLTATKVAEGMKVDDVTIWGGGISIDQHIGKTLNAGTKLPTLELGVQSTLGVGAHPFSRMCYSAALQPVPAVDDPAVVWDRLFKDLPATGAPATGTPTVDPIREQRRSVLDFVRPEYERLATRMSGNDKLKMDRHLTTVREIEKQLAAPVIVAAGCSKPAAPGAQAVTSPAQFPALGKLQMDLLAMALACDLTRVASLQWSWARSDVAHTWIQGTESHHEMSHGPANPSPAKLGNINKWYSEQVLYFINKLNSLKEDGGSVLDNSVVWWCSDIAFGPLHSFDDVRVFLFGSCGGYFKTGQHVAMSSPNNTDAQLMVSLMHAMGLTTQTRFGDPTAPAGPLPGLTV